MKGYKLQKGVLLFFIMVFAVLGKSNMIGYAKEEEKDIKLNIYVSDYLDDDNSIKYYKFQLTKQGYFNLSFENIGEEVSYGWTISILNSEYEVIYNQKQVKTKMISPNYGFEPGDYYIKVEPGWDYIGQVPINVDYKMKVGFKESSYWESEANDTDKTADKLTIGKEYSGIFHNSSDKDYYKFTIKEKGYVNFDFTYDGEREPYGWNITVLDEFLNIVYHIKGVKTTLKSPNFGLKPGDYYIKLEANWDYFTYGPINKPYHLKVNQKKTAFWEEETNDTPETANVIKIGTSYTGNLGNLNSDKDYYTFQIATKGTFDLNFTFKSEEVSYGWTISILDENYKELYKQEKIKTQEQIKNIVLTKGTYYVKIEAGWAYFDYYPAWVDYTFTVIAKETEKNDTQKTANKFYLNKITASNYTGNFRGSLSTKTDIDYIKVTVPFKSSNAITIAGSKANTHKVTIYNSKGTELVNFLNNKKSLTKTVDLEKGTYYIKIVSGANFVKTGYTITINSTKKEAKE